MNGPALFFDDRPRPGDADTLYQGSGRWPCTRFWSFRGRAPSPLLIAGRLSGPGRRLRMVRGSTGELLGVIGIVPAGEDDGGCADLSFVVTDDPGRGSGLRSMLQRAVADAFLSRPDLRKLAIEAYADDIGEMADHLDTARPAGRLRNHVRRDAGHGAAFADLLLFEVWSPARQEVGR